MTALHRAATVLTIAALVIVTATAVLVLNRRAREALGLGATGGYAVGDPIDLPRSWLSNSTFTAVLFVRHSCPSCQAAAPHLARLVEEAQLRRISVIAVTGRSALQQDRKFARSVGLTDSDVHDADLRAMALRLVPTVLLVAPDGRIVHVTEGVVGAADVETLLQAAGADPQ